MEKRNWLIGACVLTLMLAGSARGQSTTASGYGSTAPVLALPGQTISVCAFNWETGPIPSGPVTITEQIVDVVVGGAVAQQTVTLPISPFDPHRPSPCLQLTVPATAVSPAGPGELVIGAVILYLPPATGTSSAPMPATLLSASMNVSGSSVQTIPIAIQSLLSSSACLGRLCRAVPELVAP
ncbi:MAG TPA: hypothetical protein VHY84_27765 [Bryobacteraceae bacterium]|jgi:hypothetical protein|nr:hypothetical protein [Bryobacteraceae bacterium]